MTMARGSWAADPTRHGPVREVHRLERSLQVPAAPDCVYSESSFLVRTHIASWTLRLSKPASPRPFVPTSPHSPVSFTESGGAWSLRVERHAWGWSIAALRGAALASLRRHCHHSMVMISKHSSRGSGCGGGGRGRRFGTERGRTSAAVTAPPRAPGTPPRCATVLCPCEPFACFADAKGKTAMHIQQRPPTPNPVLTDRQ